MHELAVGDRFNRLTFVKKLSERKRGSVAGLWICECGSEKIAAISLVRSSHLKSCGCLRTKHGFASRYRNRTPEYVAWQAMNCRCNATTGRDFEAYGARGIGVCESWACFENFLSDMGPRPSPKHSVGRINNDLGYAPDNCRWETPKQQQVNTRKSMIWHIKGHAFDSCRDAASFFGVDHKTVRYWTKTLTETCYAVSKY